MSNLSFARIMYGAAQESPAYAALPPANSRSLLSATSDSTPPAFSSPANSSTESLLHKAWHALTRHH